MSDKHVCTGCGEEAYSQCVECGEWRCLECRTIGNWCAQKAGTDRGAFCARNRPEAKRGAKCRCSIVGHVCDGAVRGIRGTLHGEPFGEHLYYCAKFLASLPGSAVNGWCEVPDLTWHMAVARVRGQAGGLRTVLKMPAGLPPGKYVAEYVEDPSCELGMGTQEPVPSPTDPWACTTCGNDLRRDPDGRHWDNLVNGRGYCDACWKKREAVACPSCFGTARWKDCNNHTCVHHFTRFFQADPASCLTVWRACGSPSAIKFPSPADASRLVQRAKEYIEHHRAIAGSGVAIPRDAPSLLAAPGNPPGLTEANVVGVHTFDHVRVVPNPPPTPRIVTYCENAPLYEIVHRTMVRCGSGLDGGKPVMAPMVWTRKMLQEMARHVAFAPDGFVEYLGGGEWRGVPGKLTRDHDVSGLEVANDRFGGVSLGERCALCGGWIRRLNVVP